MILGELTTGAVAAVGTAGTRRVHKRGIVAADVLGLQQVALNTR